MESQHSIDRILEVKIDSLKELNNVKFNGIEQVLLRMEKDNLDHKAEYEAKRLEMNKRIDGLENQLNKDRERIDIKITAMQKLIWTAVGMVVIIAFVVPIVVPLIFKH